MKRTAQGGETPESTKVMPAPATAWSNLDKDRRAWELAQAALGPDADLHALITRAQEIKGTL